MDDATAELPQDAEPPSNAVDEALEIAIKAAETCREALKLADDPVQKQTLHARFRSLLAHAERIKLDRSSKRTLPSEKLPSVSLPPGVKAGAAQNSILDASRVRKLKVPKSTREPSTAEKIILLKASQLNGFKFTPWTGSPTDADFELHDGEDLFLDQPELRLSADQQGVFDGWRRAVDALPPPVWFPGGRKDLGPVMSSCRNVDLVQDAATDCSVVASLCSVTARAERGHANLLSSILFPSNKEKKSPRISVNGKYIVRLNLNGTDRRVEIDDRLPTSETSHVLHIVDRNNPGLLWPALIEKAYLKIRSGYDFPGSNSGTDLWILTGWIPEQVFLHSDQVEPDRLWKRIVHGFHYGDVLITLGTSNITDVEECATGLVGNHNYAVLDLREMDGQKLFLIKNAWCDGTSWQGSIPEHKEEPIQPGSHMGDMSLLDCERESEPLQSSRDLLNADERLSPGTFWMDLDNVMQHFESFHLNWYPGLFSHRQDIHFAWDLSARVGDDEWRAHYSSLTDHTQVTVSADNGGTVWIILCRHFKNAPAADSKDGNAHEYGEVDLNGFINIYAFDTNGQRVLLADQALEKGLLVDSPQVLLKLNNLAPGKPYTIVPTEQGLASTKHTFTLSAFSNSPITLGQAEPKYAYSATLAAVWTKDTAGGNVQSPTYSSNPQFSITLSQPTSLSLLLETAEHKLNVHVKLVLGGGRRIYAIGGKDIVFDSKEHRRGCCVAEFADLDAGSYTIICNTFEPAQLGPFTLRIDSSHPANTTLLPREGAGRLVMQLASALFQPGEMKIAAPLLPRRLVRLAGVARHMDSSPQWKYSNMTFPASASRSLVRMSIEVGRGPRRHILMTSNGGEFADSINGVRTEDVDLKPEVLRNNDYYLVLARMYVPPHVQDERLAVQLFVDQPGALAVGVWRGWNDGSAGR